MQVLECTGWVHRVLQHKLSNSLDADVRARTHTHTPVHARAHMHNRSRMDRHARARAGARAHTDARTYTRTHVPRPMRLHTRSLCTRAHEGIRARSCAALHSMARAVAPMECAPIATRAGCRWCQDFKLPLGRVFASMKPTDTFILAWSSPMDLLSMEARARSTPRIPFSSAHPQRGGRSAVLVLGRVRCGCGRGARGRDARHRRS